MPAPVRRGSPRHDPQGCCHSRVVKYPTSPHMSRLVRPAVRTAAFRQRTQVRLLRGSPAAGVAHPGPSCRPAAGGGQHTRKAGMPLPPGHDVIQCAPHSAVQRGGGPGGPARRVRRAGTRRAGWAKSGGPRAVRHAGDTPIDAPCCLGQAERRQPFNWACSRPFCRIANRIGSQADERVQRLPRIDAERARCKGAGSTTALATALPRRGRRVTFSELAFHRPRGA
jgi:hypothetical protein